jgi:ADP-heptose:LPS heptosyltransferase
MPSSILVNFVYCHPVGHAVEGLHRAHGYRVANPDARIGIVLNSHTPVELARLCPFVDEVYDVPVDVFDPTADHAAALARVPRGWDHVQDDVRSRLPDQAAVFPGLAAYYEASRTHLAGSAIGVAGHGNVPYARGAHWRFALPEAPPADHPRIALLPGGSAPRENYPSVRSWTTIVGALLRRHPDAEFVLLGKLRADGRTATTFTRAELDEIAAAAPRVLDAVDLPLIEQLTAVKGCDVLVSPHSGFGMAALAAGTPWLVIGGNRWPEYFYNGVPFHSVLPDVTRFPAYTTLGPDPDPVDDDGPRSPSMSFERVTADLDEIVEHASRLIAREITHDEALRTHVRGMLHLRGGDASALWSLDDVHRDFLP